MDLGRAIESADEALGLGASFGEVVRGLVARGEPARVTALVRERLALPFERIAERAGRIARARGRRPSAFLANLGPLAAHGARAGFAHGVFEAGGFTVLTNDGFASPEAVALAFGASAADVAVLCSSDALYGELGERAARALAERAPVGLVLAGNPGEHEAAYRAAGVTDFVFLGSDVAATLSRLLEQIGAAR